VSPSPAFEVLAARCWRSVIAEMETAEVLAGITARQIADAEWEAGVRRPRSVARMSHRRAWWDPEPEPEPFRSAVELAMPRVAAVIVAAGWTPAAEEAPSPPTAAAAPRNDPERTSDPRSRPEANVGPRRETARARSGASLGRGSGGGPRSAGAMAEAGMGRVGQSLEGGSR